MEKKLSINLMDTLRIEVVFLSMILSVFGAIIGLELITRTGITPNTSMVGALIAVLVSKIPLKLFSRFRDMEQQNLVQTAISGATFSAANALLLPIGIPYFMGRPELVAPMLLGVGMAVLVDATILFNTFDSKLFPASEPWPSGIASSQTIIAANGKGKKSKFLLYGIFSGIAGSSGKLGFKIPMDLLGVSMVGSKYALSAFAVGLLIRGYSPKLFKINLDTLYLPHGFMIGAGFIALYQMIGITFKKNPGENIKESLSGLKKTFSKGYIAFVSIAIFLGITTGIINDMSPVMFVFWVIFAGISAIISELIVGISAMHSGWFPAFATALIFLIIGLLIGFPPVALAVLVGFTASTGPSFADMGFDLKAGWIIRGMSKDPAKEIQGRKQQYIIEMISFLIAISVVSIVYKFYFTQGLYPPVVKTFVATIEAGSNRGVLKYLLIWAIPGAIIQFIGGPQKQLGVLFSTGLLINYPVAGITVALGLIVRNIIEAKYKEKGAETLKILGAGFIAGSALQSFIGGTLKLGKK